MLTESERIKADIAKAKAELANLDRDIQGRETRLRIIRQYRERKYNELARLEAQQEREDAPLRKVQPTGATVESPSDGVVWQV